LASIENIFMQWKKSDKIFYGCAIFSSGVIAASINFLLAAILWSGLLLTIVFVRKRIDAIFLLLTFSLGVFFILIRSPSFGANDIFHFCGKEVTFSGIVVEEPEISGGRQKLIVFAEFILNGFAVNEIGGKVLLNTKSFPQYEYGDRLSVSCRPQSLPAEYVKNDIFVSCDFPVLEKLETGRGNGFSSFLFKVKRAFIEKVNATTREPHAALLAGILIGARSGLPADLADDFRRAGISHIIALSGYNITVVSAMIINFLIFLRLRRQYAFWFSIAGIFCFVVMTGMSASVVRAGIMGVIVLLSRQLGQITKIRNIIMITFVVMVIIDPLVWKDVGFQLSFAATIGLVCLSNRVLKYFLWVPERFACRENVSSNAAAILATLPITVFYFKKFSLVALAVNFLVLPAIPLIMLLGFVQVILSLISITAAKIFGLSTFILLDYVIRAAHVFAALPWAVVEL
jgi:competence protein ComEC